MAPQPLHVANEQDLSILVEAWEAAFDGEPRAVLLEAPVGGGKRALVGELVRRHLADEQNAIAWRVAVHDEEDGLQALMRIYAGLFAALHRDPLLRGRVEMALNAQLPQRPKRVQDWYRAFVEGLKKGAPKPGEQQFQVIVPRDDPLAGLVEIALGVARKFPVLVDLQNLHHCHSIGVLAAIEALLARASAEEDGARLLLVLGTEPLDDDRVRARASRALLDLVERRGDDLVRLRMRPWDADDVRRYIETRAEDERTRKGRDEAESAARAEAVLALRGGEADIARVAGGRPGFVAELVDWLADEGRTGDELGGLSLPAIADVTPDADELGDAEDGEAARGRKRATAEDAERVAYMAALLGLSFPSGLVADMGGWDRDSIDDLLDATERIYKELQFSEPLQTWVYQFRRALYRESVLSRHDSDEDRETARRVASFLERFLAPRGFPYLAKTLQVTAHAGDEKRAEMLAASAMASDPPNLWAMAREVMKLHADVVDWPDSAWRTVLMHLVERMVQLGDVQQADRTWNEAMEWAQAREDRPMEAWLLLAGSRLDHRRQDLYRARDRARDALRLYEALEDAVRQAEACNQLALVELADGNPNAALEHAAEAEKRAAIPPVQAQAEFVRGSVRRRDRKQLSAAIEHFRRANELAGRSGMALLALEAGLALGETLLVAGQHATAADVLGRVVQIARALRSAPRERTATALLAQAHAALQNYEAALEQAKRTLELTRQLRYDRLEAVDLYNVGFFHLMLRRPTEAVAIFKQAREKMDATQPAFAKELLFNYGQALLQIGEKTKALEMLRESLVHAESARDWQKLAVAARTLGDLEAEGGRKGPARAFYERALAAAEKGNLKDMRKEIRRRMDRLRADA